MNTPAPLGVKLAQERVLGWQTKLHRWAVQDEQQRFGDLFNLICDPATLLVAWERVKRNRGSRTAGVDGQTRKRVEQMGVDGVLAELRQELKDGTYRPLPARERLIPKRSCSSPTAHRCSLVCHPSTRSDAAFTSSGAGEFTPDLPNGFCRCGPAVRLGHVDGFPALGLLHGLRHAPRPSAGIGPYRAATSSPARTVRFPRSPRSV